MPGLKPSFELFGASEVKKAGTVEMRWIHCLRLNDGVYGANWSNWVFWAWLSNTGGIFKGVRFGHPWLLRLYSTNRQATGQSSDHPRSLLREIYHMELMNDNTEIRVLSLVIRDQASTLQKRVKLNIFNLSFAVLYLLLLRPIRLSIGCMRWLHRLASP